MNDKIFQNEGNPFVCLMGAVDCLRYFRLEGLQSGSIWHFKLETATLTVVNSQTPHAGRHWAARHGFLAVKNQVYRLHSPSLFLRREFEMLVCWQKSVCWQISVKRAACLQNSVMGAMSQISVWCGLPEIQQVWGYEQSWNARIVPRLLLR